MPRSSFVLIGLVFDAIERADHAMVETLATSMPANYRDAEGHTPLMRAAKLGDARSVELLLAWSDPLALLEEAGSKRAEAVFSAQRASEGSAMAMAADLGHADCVRLLASLVGTAPVDLFGRTALIIAARAGQLDCVKILAQGNAPLIADARDIHWTPLMAAVRHGHADCVEFLAPLSDLSAVDRNERTALMLAAHERRPECLRVIATLSDCDYVSPKRHATALMDALSRDTGRVNAESIEILLARCDDATVNAQLEKNARTALMMAIEDSECPRAVELLAARSDHSLRDKKGETAWDIALRCARRFESRGNRTTLDSGAEFFFNGADSFSAFYPAQQALGLLALCPQDFRPQWMPRLSALREATQLQEEINATRAAFSTASQPLATSDAAISRLDGLSRRL